VRTSATSISPTVENYFNYFTEIEECYRAARGTPSLLSTLDWALIESWKEAGIPLEAVLAGIERAFEKYHKRPRRSRRVNSLAYCAQEVLRAAEEASTQPPAQRGETQAVESPFPPEQVRAFFERNASVLLEGAERGPVIIREDFAAGAATLADLKARSAQPSPDFQDIERHLTALEEKLGAALTRASSVELLAQFHEEVDRGVAPYRRKMNAAEVERLERQFMKKRLFEHYGVPRLSLFYL
jgi:hypothetical protein